jgi:hypothetical protein
LAFLPSLWVTMAPPHEGGETPDAWVAGHDAILDLPQE